MKQKLSTIVFFGNEQLATGVSSKAPTLRNLIQKGYDVKAVVISQAESKSRNNRLTEVELLAKEYNIELLRPSKLSEIQDRLKSFGAEAGVLAAFGKIIPPSIIDIFPKGIVNIHPSLLPLGRGPTPLEQVILEGAKKSGVSIMQLVQKMDAGPVYVQSEIALEGNETKQELADKLNLLGSQLIVDNLPEILSGTLKPSIQDESKATYNKLIKKEFGIIDWRKPAEDLEREIRAYKNWPKSRTVLGGKDFIISEVKVSPSVTQKAGHVTVDQGRLIVDTGKDALEIVKLQPLNKPEMTIDAFLAGYRKLFN